MKKEKMFGKCGGLSLLTFLIVFLSSFFAPKEAHAIAAWARKYNADCNMCHTMFPQLNKNGYIFRANGYRMPGESAEDEEFNVTNAFSARGFFQLVNVNNAINKSTDPIDDAKTGFRLKEVQLFAASPIPQTPLSYFGEFVFNEDGEEGAMVENFFLRYAKPSGDNLLYAKLGQFHAIEGYMGIDRPLVSTRPYVINKKPSTVTTSRAWHDERGITLGYLMGSDINKPTTSLALSILNGLDETGTGIHGDNAETQNKNGAFDLQFIGTHFFDSRNALSLYYFTGKNAQDTDADGKSNYENSFNRWGLFGNFYATDALNLQAGYLTRKEEDSATTSLSAKGLYGQMDYQFKPGIFGVVRYEKWDPSDKAASDETTGWTAGLFDEFAKGARASLEYETSKKPTTESENLIRAELQVMW